MNFDHADLAYQPTTGVRRWHETPLIRASDQSLRGYGCLVDDPTQFPIEIVRWPAQGWRPIDLNSGNQGGVTEGSFEFWWRSETLYARNNAVGDSYLFGWSRWPEEAGRLPSAPRERAMIWRANYHPDGGQLVYPRARYPFVVPLALPGDDVTPDRFVSYLWQQMQSIPQYRNRTTFIITADHGRGSGTADWKDHGVAQPGSDNIWIGVVGPDTAPLGERGRIPDVTQSQIAATIAEFAGEDFRAFKPAAAPSLFKLMQAPPP